MRSKEITNNADVLDSHNIQKRYDYLTQEIEDAFYDSGRESFDFLAAWEKCEDKAERIINILESRGVLDYSLFDEWKLIRKTFIDNMSDFYMWNDGMPFFRDSYMDADWAEEEMKDLGFIPQDLSPLIRDNIDFDGVLEDLQNGYNYVDFDGIKYWYQEV